MRTGDQTTPRQNQRIVARAALFLTLILIGASMGTGAAQEGVTAAGADREEALLSGARLAVQNGEWVRALELSEEALRSGADRVQVLLLKARIYGRMRDVAKQRQALHAVVAMDDSLWEPRLALAMLEEGRGLWQRAAELYREVIAINPRCRPAYLRLATLYERNDQPHQALTILQQSMAHNPDDSRLLVAIAGMYWRRGLLQQAEAVYGQLVQVGDEAARAEAFTRLGEIYTQVGE